ncbi:hypothetical protein NDU88_004305 [Pleurodeles waltl]|uniref:Uncharacterized protein n=1 Tax=Pleurodeles waltl TaxID=8319 RepID=A0AAV7V111_PLEWA|nr:hypothetical protein NDU88_004305 [Pleurodeles waltl]
MMTYQLTDSDFQARTFWRAEPALRQPAGLLHGQPARNDEDCSRVPFMPLAVGSHCRHGAVGPASSCLTCRVNGATGVGLGSSSRAAGGQWDPPSNPFLDSKITAAVSSLPSTGVQLMARVSRGQRCLGRGGSWDIRNAALLAQSAAKNL